MLKMIAWNIARREAAWRLLLGSGADVALLQEACEPPRNVAQKIGVDPTPWRTDGLNRPWRTVAVKLSDRVKVDRLESKPAAVLRGRPRPRLGGALASSCTGDAERATWELEIVAPLRLGTNPAAGAAPYFSSSSSQRSTLARRNRRWRFLPMPVFTHGSGCHGRSVNRRTVSSLRRGSFAVSVVDHYLAEVHVLAHGGQVVISNISIAPWYRVAVLASPTRAAYNLHHTFKKQ
jgi:hypothetical protein